LCLHRQIQPSLVSCPPHQASSATTVTQEGNRGSRPATSSSPRRTTASAGTCPLPPPLARGPARAATGGHTSRVHLREVTQEGHDGDRQTDPEGGYPINVQELARFSFLLTFRSLFLFYIYTYT
jgi:hypothetical protein